MLISHKYKFIMLRSVKTASTSTLGYFQNFCMPENEVVKPTLEFTPEKVSEVGIVGPRGVGNIENSKWRPHITSRELKELLVTENLENPIWDNYYKFCNVRNPYNKAMSMYFDQKFRKNIELFELDIERQEFETWVKTSYGSDFTIYTDNSKFCLDDTIRYENLFTDLERVCTKLGITWTPEDFPTFKTNRRPATVTASMLYTETAKTYIQDKCAVELSIFNYEFPA
jgi:hypothetical protein